MIRPFACPLQCVLGRELSLKQVLNVGLASNVSRADRVEQMLQLLVRMLEYVWYAIQASTRSSIQLIVHLSNYLKQVVSGQRDRISY